MPPGVNSAVEYSFAAEYHGPVPSYDLPCAVPVNVEKIPVASVVSKAPFSSNFSVPVVSPILSLDLSSQKLSKEANARGSGVNVSPTSVITFDARSEADRDSMSRELASTSEATLSTTSLTWMGDREAASHDLGFSHDLGTLESECGELDETALGSSFNSHEISGGLSGELESSGMLEYAAGLVNSGELSTCSAARGTSIVNKEGLNFNDANVPLWASRDSKDNDYVELSCEEDDEIIARKESGNKPRKGACYRCEKGSRFTEKEVCLVCDAKYCCNCVLRAMGSMPEGRKCVTCIGNPIDESKRGQLGKCSRMLKRLLNGLEVRQIMKTEKLCEANQLPSEFICVNGKTLCQDELVLLQSCLIPPKKLKPGNYWYDKVSGLWGKEGQKPSQIISPHLNVGGPIEANASSGNTQVFINGREITKVELRMLQLSGVQCAGNPHFWVNEDGSYQEEGQKNTKGYIWGKAATRLICTALSLPIPSSPRSPTSKGDKTNKMLGRNVVQYLEQRVLQKILLVGHSGSGTSTIFKQVKILYQAEPFSREELENIGLRIQSNLYAYLGILLEGRERFEEESLNELKNNQSVDVVDGDVNVRTVYTISPRLKSFADWLLKTMVSGTLEAIFPAASREYAPLVEELWTDNAIQAAYKRRNELKTLPAVAGYFLERAVDILRTDYEPSDTDILNAEGIISSNGVASSDFSFPPHGNDQLDNLLRYQLIRVHARGLGENCKWIEMFEDVRLVMFCITLSDYDECVVDIDGAPVNKMLLSKRFFEDVVNHPAFYAMDFLLVLTKFDVFEGKVERVPLCCCDWFSEFRPVATRQRSSSNGGSVGSSPSLGLLAFHFVAVKFKRLFASLTERKLYVLCVNGLDRDGVDSAIRFASEIVKWEDEKLEFNFGEHSVCSTEGSYCSE